MAATFPFRLITPERTVLEGEPEMVTARTAGGDIAFLAGHVPFIGAVEIGVVRMVLPDGSEHPAAVHGGFIEVKGGEVFLVAGVAELAGEIDVARAERALQDAESRLAASGDDAGAEAAARRARARLELAGRPVAEGVS
jgi:F-type H+-transporting ATPase subunit epsilon